MSSTTPDSEQTKRSLIAQFPRNLTANIFYFLANIIIGILLVPYFINTLGVATYGILPLATSIIGYAGIIITSLNASVSRFLTVDLQSNNYAAANRTFNTAFFGFTAVILLMTLPIFILAFFTPSIFNVPDGQEAGCILLFLGVSSAFIIRSWSANFTVQLFAYNRLDLQNIVNLTSLIVSTGLIILFFYLFSPNLGLVGAAYLTGAVVASGVSIILARQVCPHLKISFGSFDRGRFRDLCKLGLWVIINEIGYLLILQIDLIVVNILFGATLAGEYAIAYQLVILLRMFAGVLYGIQMPTILSLYAQKQIETMIRVLKSFVKLMGLGIALPAGLICGLSPNVLIIWVGGEFTFLAPLIILMTVHLAINFSVMPLNTINVAYNKMIIPGLITLLLGILNVSLAVTLSLLTDLGYYGVAIAGLFTITFRNAIFIPWYATRLLGVGHFTFIRSIFPGIVATVIIGAMAATLGTIFQISALPSLIVVGVGIAGVYLVMVWIFGLNEFERGLFKSYLTPVFKRISANL